MAPSRGAEAETPVVSAWLDAKGGGGESAKLWLFDRSQLFPVPLDTASPWTVRLPRVGAEFALIDLSEAAMVAALAVEKFKPRLLVRDYHPEMDQRQLINSK